MPYNSKGYFDVVDDEVSSIKQNVYFNEYLLADPIFINDEQYDQRRVNYQNIRDLFITARNIFKEIVSKNSRFSQSLKYLLLNDSNSQISENFYSILPPEAWTIPVFFRTDESKAGKIFEIQCPGSGWGDVVLLESVLKNNYTNGALPFYDLVNTYVNSLQRHFDGYTPSVMHLLDNSSNPSMMRYFISKTSSYLKYWGYSKEVKNAECNFIRSHSVYGLIAENLFKHRLKLVEGGKAKFDLPPLLIFDQKMTLCLPFLEETRGLFSEDIRKMLVYTNPIYPRGFRDFGGNWITIEDFLKRPPGQRKYFLKYGGCDTSANWGSRAVYRLDTKAASDLLKKATLDFINNRPWVIQPASSEKETVTYLTRTNDQPITENLTAKYSTFYGPNGVMSIRTHHRKSTKVHGQPDSIAGIAYKKQV
jgi:hypothetical protein